MGNLAPLMSSAKSDWQTPPEILDIVRQLGPIDLDPATDDTNPTGAARYYTPKQDGLASPWTSSGLVYLNPPYGRGIAPWTRRLVAEYTRCEYRHAVALLPARPDTRWWQDSVGQCSAICFWKGRIQFVGAPDPAPFPSAFWYLGAERFRFADIFENHGWVVLP